MPANQQLNEELLQLARKKGKIEEIKILIQKGADVTYQDENGFTVLLLAASAGELMTVQWLVENNNSLLKQTTNHGDTALLRAAYHGHLEVVKWLLHNGSSPEETTSHGYTALLIAALNGHLEVMKWLLHNGSSLEETTSHGYTALLVAALNGHLEVVKWLHDKGALLKETDYHGHTALLVAASNGHLDVVKWLLANGAKLDETNEYGLTALLVAALNGQLKMAQWLLVNGALPQEKSNIGNTVLLVSAQGGHLELVQWLHDNGTSLDETNELGNTALIIAASNGHLELVQWLHDKGASLVQPNELGNTALLFAASNGHLELVQWLHDKGVLLDETNEFGDTALLFAASNGHLELVQWLHDKGVLLDETNKLGNTALIIAARNGHLELVQWLHDKGASLVQPNELGNTALLFAASNGHLELVKWLLDNGASLQETNEFGDTALLLAASKGHLELVKWLLDNSASLQETNKIGNTALLVAASNGHLELVQWLLSIGASFQETNINGETVTLVASRHEHHDIVEWLLKYEILLQEFNKDGYTLLLRAARQGQLESMQWLLDRRRASLQETNNAGERAVLIAAKQGHFKIVEWLLNQEVSIEPDRDSEGNTVLHILAQEADSSIVSTIEALPQQFIKKTLNDENEQGDTPLIIAISRNLALCEYFFEHFKSDIDWDFMDEQENTLLHLLAQYGVSGKTKGHSNNPVNNNLIAQSGVLEIIDIVKHFELSSLQRMINQPNKRGRTPVMLAIMHNHPLYEHLYSATKLRVNRALTDGDGNTLLHLFAKYGFFNRQHVAWLQEKGHIVFDQLNDKEKAPLELAVKYDNQLMVHHLLSTYKYQRTELIKAIKVGIQYSNDFQVIDKLLETYKMWDKYYEQSLADHSFLHLGIIHNRDLTLAHLLWEHSHIFVPQLQVSDEKGRKPLTLAAELNRFVIIQYLLDNQMQFGLTVNDEDRAGYTAIYRAIEQGHFEATDLLAHSGAELNMMRKVSYNGDELELTPKLLAKQYKENWAKAGENPYKRIFNLLTRVSAQTNIPVPLSYHRNRPRNLVFQGGGAKGVVYPGVFQALEAMGLLTDVERFAGTSVGAITALFGALGYSVDKLEEFNKEVNFIDFIGNDLFQEVRKKGVLKTAIHKLWRQVVDDPALIASMIGGVITGDLTAVTMQASKKLWKGLINKTIEIYNTPGLCRGDLLNTYLEKKIAEKTNVKECTFGKLKELINKGKPLKHLYVVVTNLTTGQAEVLSSEDENCKDIIIADAVTASAAFPGIFQPRTIRTKTNRGGRIVYGQLRDLFVDGGMLKNYPLDIFDKRCYDPSFAGPVALGEEPFSNPYTLGFRPQDEPIKEEDIKQRTVDNLSQLVTALGLVYWNAEENYLSKQYRYKERTVILPLPDGVGTFSFTLDEETKDNGVHLAKDAVGKFLKSKPMLIKPRYGRCGDDGICESPDVTASNTDTSTTSSSSFFGSGAMAMEIDDELSGTDTETKHPTEAPAATSFAYQLRSPLATIMSETQHLVEQVIAGLYPAPPSTTKHDVSINEKIASSQTLRHSHQFSLPKSSASSAKLALTAEPEVTSRPVTLTPQSPDFNNSLSLAFVLWHWGKTAVSTTKETLFAWWNLQESVELQTKDVKVNDTLQAIRLEGWEAMELRRDYIQAREQFQSALRVAKQHNKQTLIQQLTLDLAYSYLNEAKALASKQSKKTSTPKTSLEAFDTSCIRGNIKRAYHYFKEASGYDKEGDELVAVGLMELSQFVDELALDDEEDIAAQSIRFALTLDPGWQADDLQARGLAALKKGEASIAQTHFTDALALYNSLDDDRATHKTSMLLGATQLFKVMNVTQTDEQQTYTVAQKLLVEARRHFQRASRQTELARQCNYAISEIETLQAKLKTLQKGKEKVDTVTSNVEFTVVSQARTRSSGSEAEALLQRGFFGTAHTTVPHAIPSTNRALHPELISRNLQIG